MKHIIIIIITIISMTLSFGQSSKEQDFGRILKKVITALANRDSATLSKHTDRETGVFILNRIGVTDTYKHYATLGFTDSTYPNFPFYNEVRMTALQYSTLPTFDCEKWTKTGTFVDTTQTDHLLSEIANGLNKERKGTIPLNIINAYYNLENKSRRIVIADNSGNELIIYLSVVNNKWVLTIIDKVTCDCSV